MFDCRYVEHCVQEGMLLSNLRDYRINTQSVYEDYDPFDILLGRRKWSDVPEKPEGIRVPDFDFDFGSRQEFQRDNDNRYKNFKSSKMSYTRREQKEILKFLIDAMAFSLTTGNTIWKRMEHRDLCNGNR